MKCYCCKEDVPTAFRRYMEARDKREISQYRDICEECYPLQMEKEGYQQQGGAWIKS